MVLGGKGKAATVEQAEIPMEPARQQSEIERLQAIADAAFAELEAARVKLGETNSHITALNVEARRIENIHPSDRTPEMIERLGAIPSERVPFLKTAAARQQVVDQLEKRFWERGQAVNDAINYAAQLKAQGIPNQYMAIASRERYVAEAKRELAMREGSLQEAENNLQLLFLEYERLTGEVLTNEQ